MHMIENQAGSHCATMEPSKRIDFTLVAVLAVFCAVSCKGDVTAPRDSVTLRCLYTISPRLGHYTKITIVWRRSGSQLILTESVAVGSADRKPDENNFGLTSRNGARYGSTRTGDCIIHNVTSDDAGAYDCYVQIKLSERYETLRSSAELIILAPRDLPSDTPSSDNTDAYDATQDTTTLTVLSKQNAITDQHIDTINITNDVVDQQMKEVLLQDEVQGADVDRIITLSVAVVGTFAIIAAIIIVIWHRRKKTTQNKCDEEKNMMRTSSSSTAETDTGSRQQQPRRISDISDDVFIDEDSPPTSETIKPSWVELYYERMRSVSASRLAARGNYDDTFIHTSNRHTPGAFSKYRSELGDLIAMSSTFSSQSSVSIDSTGGQTRVSSCYLPHQGQDAFEIPRSNISVGRQLGTGHFGQVYEATLTLKDCVKTQKVAVKTLKEPVTYAEKLNLIRELEMMKRFGHHPYVVALLGCCTKPDIASPIYLVMELATCGNLRDFLRKYRRLHEQGQAPHDISRLHRDLVYFAWQIADGMAFIHKSRCIHRDLAARNILVCEDMTCRIADFGLAKTINEDEIYEKKSEGPLPVRWMAPESLSKNVYTIYSDVWSYGIMVYEIITLGSTPYPQCSMQEVRTRVESGHIMDKPTHCTEDIFMIMKRCWQMVPEKRPKFKDISSQLFDMATNQKKHIRICQLDRSVYVNLDDRENRDERL